MKHEWGMAYWYDAVLPEWMGDASSERYKNGRLCGLIVRAICDAVPFKLDLYDIGLEGIRVIHLPASDRGRRELIPDKDITLFQLSTTVIAKFPELADLPFRKYDPTKGAA